MAQKIVLGYVLDNVLRDIAKKSEFSDESGVRRQIDSRLTSVLGQSWTDLPISGPRMMALLIVLNIILAPMGIVPALVIDNMIKQAKEMNLDPRVMEFGNAVKDRGVDQINKIKGLAPYFDEAKINLQEVIPDGAGHFLNRSLGGIKSIFRRSKDKVQDTFKSGSNKKEVEESK